MYLYNALSIFLLMIEFTEDDPEVADEDDDEFEEDDDLLSALEEEIS